MNTKPEPRYTNQGSRVKSRDDSRTTNHIMQHYDENTIELFAIGSETVSDKREEFEKHLKECHYCHDLYNEILRFYQIMDGSYPLLESSEVEKSTSLVISPQFVDKHQSESIVPYRESLPIRFVNYIFKKPIRSTISFTSACALLFFALNTKDLLKDNNPFYIKTNDETSTLEVYNHEGDKLWQKIGKEKDKNIMKMN